MATKKLSILGSTGSIGTQTLPLVEALGIDITALSGYQNATLLERQALRFRPKMVCVVDETAAKTLRVRLKPEGIDVLSGEEGLLEIASNDESDTLLNAIVGIAGLRPTLAAIESGKNIALANKETLIAGGKIVTDAVKQRGVKMLPVDSEHSAIFQCIEGSKGQAISRVFLTASGGPFYGKTKDALKKVTVADALQHPNWVMGRKITIDSATLMNKGLELIEAMWFFDVSPEQIEVAVHRQSIVHSMVEFIDRSVIAQLGMPDMRLPIQYALTYPERRETPVQPLTIEMMGNLTFAHPDDKTFGCLAASVKAARRGGIVPVVANAANERAVELFLQEKISFLDIGETVERMVEECGEMREYTVDDILFFDRETRRKVDACFS